MPLHIDDVSDHCVGGLRHCSYLLCETLEAPKVGMSRPCCAFQRALCLGHYDCIGLGTPSIPCGHTKDLGEDQYREVRSGKRSFNDCIHVLIGESVSNADEPVDWRGVVSQATAKRGP